MAGTVGIEPTSMVFSVHRSNRLSYIPKYLTKAKTALSEQGVSVEIPDRKYTLSRYLRLPRFLRLSHSKLLTDRSFISALLSHKANGLRRPCQGKIMPSVESPDTLMS